MCCFKAACSARCSQTEPDGLDCRKARCWYFFTKLEALKEQSILPTIYSISRPTSSPPSHPPFGTVRHQLQCKYSANYKQNNATVPFLKKASSTIQRTGIGRDDEQLSLPADPLQLVLPMLSPACMKNHLYIQTKMGDPKRHEEKKCS